MDKEALIWIIIGFGGQGLFMMRFLVQWWSSEKAKQVVVPVAFWYFSILGGLVLTVYAIHRSDPVFTFGQGGPSSGPPIVIRRFVDRRSTRR
mgnify:CR=1 FL=1